MDEGTEEEKIKREHVEKGQVCMLTVTELYSDLSDLSDELKYVDPLAHCSLKTQAPRDSKSAV